MHGVAHEVDHRLRDHIGIGLDARGAALRVVREAEAQVVGVEELLLAVDYAAHEAHRVDLLELERRRAVLHAREVEHLLHEAGEAAGLGGDRLQVLVVGGKHSVLHGLDRSEHRHKRRAQLMRNIRGDAALMLEVLL